jgi:tRNA(fMet)-specific endonuclease VapC
MKILFDTSAYSALARFNREICEIVSRAKDVFIPVIALGELLSGFYGGNRRAENVAQLESFLEKPSVKVFHVTADTALHYAKLDQFLSKKGRPIPRNDMWIASIAMEHGLQLLAIDKHFHEIPMLLLLP